MSNYIPHETTDVITYPWPDMNWIGLDCICSMTTCILQDILAVLCPDVLIWVLIRKWSCPPAVYDGIYTQLYLINAGTHCETNMDDCSCDPMGTDMCQDLLNGFECHCKPGFFGTNCSVCEKLVWRCSLHLYEVFLVFVYFLGPLLLTWINFNHKMDNG